MTREDSGYYMTPALGDSWSHACSTRVILDFCSKIILEGAGDKGQQMMKKLSTQNEPYHKYRSLTMVKSPRYKSPTQSAIFRITSDGIRDAL